MIVKGGAMTSASAHGKKPVIIRRTIRPGQPGTGPFVRKYGDRFVCVHVAIDTRKGIVEKTVELLVERRSLKSGKGKSSTNGRRMLIRVGLHETHVAELVRKAGGRWRREMGAWDLPHDRIVELGLEHRLLEKSH
jgi:hypothetical protein